MMSLFHAFALALLQGVTELLPISSSGYMIIAAWALGWSSPSAGFDASVHFGSTLALVLFFRRDWMLILKAAKRGRSIPLGEMMMLRVSVSNIHALSLKHLSFSKVSLTRDGKSFRHAT